MAGPPFFCDGMAKWGFGPDSKNQSDPFGPSGGKNGRRLMRHNDESTVGAFSVHNAAGRCGMGASLNMPGVRKNDGYRLNANGQDRVQKWAVK